MILRIKDWEVRFETSESRKLKKLSWVPVPNKMDGEGYTSLVDHPNGAAHLGAWLAIMEIASKQEPREARGNLPGGAAHDLGMICRSLGRISRLPSAIFVEVLPRLMTAPIMWLEVLSNEQAVLIAGESPDVPGENPDASGGSADFTAANRTELNRTRTEEKKPSAPFGAFEDARTAVEEIRTAPAKAPKGKRTTEQIKYALGPERLTWWENFWKAFPCHEGMNEALDAFERRVHDVDLARAIYRGAQRYAEKFNADPSMKLKYGSGWINGERWTDEIVIPLPPRKLSVAEQLIEDLKRKEAKCC